MNFTRFAASVLGPFGIRVNAIHPGGFLNNQPEAFIKNYSANTMLGRLANNSDLKGVVVFLASDASCYLTGTNIRRASQAQASAAIRWPSANQR